MSNDSELYYRHRDRFNELVELGKADSCEAAALFYYLNRTGFNGLCRFNSSGFFNVPFGRYKHINYQTDFEDYRDTFAPWNFRTGDFENIPIKEDDFIYADPPYDVEFTKYSKEDFRWDDQKRLGRWLARHSGPVVLSNQATDRIVELYESLDFEITVLKAPRMINCTGDRTPALEVLAVKGL